ncbi:MAG: hypothetical protein Q7R43_02545 [Candidatus Daviesbacteria bacterium]|nr:hypothetical protein [Candidatus Daviesbacteria bacterium]
MERSGELHLIIHKDSLLGSVRDGQRDRTQDPINQEYYSQVREVLAEIDRVSQLPNVKLVEHFSFDGQIYKDIGNAEQVIIYGCTRPFCLRSVSETAIKAGAHVSISIKGSI